MQNAFNKIKESYLEIQSSTERNNELELRINDLENERY